MALARIFQQAVYTFNAANHLELPRNLSVLKSLVDTFRYSDLELDRYFVSRQFFNQPDKAPCTYVGLYEDPTFSMSVFIMAENYTMPMHDHPNMHGLLKCIAGNLKIQSYSIDSEKEAPLNVLERLYALNPDVRPPPRKYINCIREPAVEVDENSPATLLTPDQRNIHQITAIGGPVAFFDILTPPYDTFIAARPHLKRKCTFLKVADQSLQLEEEGGGHHVVLEKIAQPLSYYCDNIEYNS